MKKLIILTLLVLGGNIYSQKLELNELKTPSTPAFTLLGLSPTNISRPSTGKPFVMSLANGFNGNSIASDVAIETSPYWWVPRPGLTYEKYFGLEEDNSMDQVTRTFALSFATSDASPDIDSIDSRLVAAGIRFQVLNGKPSHKFVNAYNNSLQKKLLVRETIGDLNIKVKNDQITKLKQLDSEIENSASTMINTNSSLNILSNREKDSLKTMAVEFIRKLVKEQGYVNFSKSDIIDFLSTERLGVTDKVNQTLIEMQGMSRVGWLLEFAGAASLLAPGNSINYTIGEDWAGWGTLTYRLDVKEGTNRMNDFNLMARLGGDFMESDSYNTDLGLSWANLGENFSLTLEGIVRSYRTYKDITATDGQIYKVSETDYTWRFALAYQYKISESINISLTAGKDFENSKITTGGMFSLLNLNLSLPSEEVILVKNN